MCRLLALAVLAKAVEDLSSEAHVSGEDRESARAFLDGADGEWWCEVAGVSPHALRRRLASRLRPHRTG
jgi:hypothetical protein